MNTGTGCVRWPERDGRAIRWIIIFRSISTENVWIFPFFSQTENDICSLKDFEKILTAKSLSNGQLSLLQVTFYDFYY